MNKSHSSSSNIQNEDNCSRQQQSKRYFTEHYLKQTPCIFPQFLPNFSCSLTKIRSIKRIITILGFTAICIPIQTLCLKIPGKSKVKFVCFYWETIYKLLGVKARTFGQLKQPFHHHDCSPHDSTQQSSLEQRPILYIANHSSWLDIPLLGGFVPASFVAKKEVGTWPLISILCKLGRVLFVSRQRQSTAKEQKDMEERLKNKGSLILFPEGTSSDGSRLLPFLSSFFVLAKPIGNKPVDYPIPIIQPISIVYDQLDYLPVNRFRRPFYSWYGDMDLAPHLWELSQFSHMQASLIFHQPIYPENFKTRKELAQKAWDVINQGTSQLRQMAPNDKIDEII